MRGTSQATAAAAGVTISSRTAFIIQYLWRSYDTFLLVLACAPAKPGIDLAAEKQTIRKLTTEWLAAEKRRDLEASLSYLAPEAVIQLDGVPIKGPTDITGKTAIRAMYEEIFEMPFTDMVWEPRTLVLAESGDLAYEIGTMKITFEGPEGRTEAPGKATIIWRKLDSRWKAVVLNVSMD
jgi:uncharacterized protein (TIGR02246 family)